MADDEDGWTGTREEIRLACVFNGGVSLAVWMGGVAHEFNEFTADGATYGPLLRLLGVQARADVITGTSAGGINGAALALAQVNRATNLTDLRRVWGEQGRLETLLNKPYRGDPVSVLRGEEVFLPELTRALHRLATPWEPRSVDERPVDLTVTTTLLDGVTLRDTDSFGQPLGQDRHDAYFRFARTTDGAGRVRDDFSADDDAAPPTPQPDVLAALGLAARASAGFPFAFEPTLIPVDATAPATDRPDMARYASWRGDRTPGPAARPDRSRYAVDGGLLNNTPTQHALAAIEQMRAGLAVDRVMMLVIPLPSEEVVEAGATVATAPSLTAMIGGLGASVASTGNRTFVDDVVEHNRRATSVRGTRHDVLAAADDGEGLRDTAARLYPHYRRLRLRRDARDLAAQPALSVGLAYDQVRADLEAVQAELDADGPGLDVLPSSLENLLTSGVTPGPWAWGSKPLVDIGAAALEYLARLVDAWPESDRGLVLAARAGVHDALARVRLVRCALDDAWREVTALATARPDRSYWRLRLSADAWLLGGAQDAHEHLTSAALTIGLDPEATLQPVLAALHAGRPGPVPSLADAGGLAGGLLGQALTTMLESVIGPTRPGTAVRNGAALTALVDDAWHPVLDAARTPEPAHARRRVWQVLACLHVAAWTIGDELPTENTNPMRLTQVSAATRNDFATFSQTVGEKLGGASLARFSGFLKRSWRMNDWAWGRFDGASALLRVLLTPRRVREVAVGRGLSRPEDVVDLLLRTAWGPEAAAVVIAARTAGESSTVPGPARLVALRARATHEVAVALRATVPVEMREGTEEADAPAMPGLTALLAYGRHVSIVHEELPEIADAVREDDADGANPRSRGRLFLTQHADLLQALATTREQPGTAAWLGNGLEALAAFDRAGIGREPLEEEAASDQLIRTAVTAAAVTATVMSGRRSGLGVLSPVTRAVKGLTMVPYWVTQGLTSGGLVARSLGLLGIAAGGVLLTLALLGLLDGALAGIGATLGAGAFLAALTYGAMRTGSHLHAVVLMAAAAALVAVGISATRGRWELSLGTGAVVGAVILVGGMMLLGSLREPMASPKVTVEDAAVSLVRRLRGTRWTDRAASAVRAGGLVVVIVLVAAVVVVLVATGADRLDRLPDWFAGRFTGPAAPWLLGAGVALLAALATIGVLFASRGLRRWQRENGTWRRERSSGSAGVAAGWSVVYGAVALLGCAVVLRWWPEGETVTWQAGWVVAVLAVFAAVLLAPVPLVILWRAHRQVRRRVRAALARVDLPDDLGDPAVRRAAWLEANGWAYASVVRVVPDGGAGRLELRPHLTRALAGASGGPNTPGL